MLWWVASLAVPSSKDTDAKRPLWLLAHLTFCVIISPTKRYPSQTPWLMSIVFLCFNYFKRSLVADHVRSQFADGICRTQYPRILRRFDYTSSAHLSRRNHSAPCQRQFGSVAYYHWQYRYTVIVLIDNNNICHFWMSNRLVLNQLWISFEAAKSFQ